MENKFIKCKIKIAPDASGLRIDNFLCDYIKQEMMPVDSGLVLSRTKIQKFILDGSILVNSKHVKPSYSIYEKDTIALNIPKESGEQIKIEKEKIDFEIIHDDKDLVVISKPAGLVVHPAHGHHSHTLLNGLLYKFPELEKNTNLSRMGLVHRLDKDTSGLLIITKNEIAQQHILAQFKERTIRKEYAAIVIGKLSDESGEIRVNIGRHPKNRKKMAVLKTGGKESLTRYEVIKYLKNATYVRLIPHTGRTHQLRVHMHYLKHPVAGDEIYSGKKTCHYPGLMLHAKKIGFIHPRTHKPMEFETGLPDRFKVILNKG